MLKINFKEFQKRIKEDKLVNHFSTIHCLTSKDFFVFMMKNREKIEYYSVVNIKDIYKFAKDENMTNEQALDMFKTNYCKNTVPLEALHLIDLIVKQKSDNAEIDLNLQDQNNPIAQNSSKKTFTPPIIKDNQLDAGDDLIDEAKDYSDFLLKFFTKLEKDVIRATASLDLEKAVTEKTLGDFLRDMFNKVNTLAFAKQIRKYIKLDLTAGLVSSEVELSMDIGFTDAFQDKLNILASQQIDGRMINGKKWPGIKGVTKEIQAEIIKIVQDGANRNKTLTEVRKDISDKFEMFSEWRSEMIARTETNRIVNEGKILGYKESGLEGQKVWSTAIDDRTSPICRRLADQKVDLDNDFVDPETKKRYASPPSHPNCRSSVYFEPI